MVQNFVTQVMWCLGFVHRFSQLCNLPDLRFSQVLSTEIMA